MRRAVGIGLGLLGLDLALVVLSGGYSVLGPAGATGFWLRLGLALALLVLRYRLRSPWSDPSRHGYLAILLLLLPLLHFLGSRLRGDALWYYPYARSLAFDRDLDFSNEYRKLGIDHFRGSQPVRETGLPRNTFPIGVGLLWIPFLALGHLGAWLRNIHGIPTAYDGFSAPYLNSVALGSLAMGWAGLLVLDRFLRRWFSPAIAFAASLGTALGSFLLWYLAFQPLYTHAPAFFFATLILDRWAREPESARDFAWLGLLVGVSACLRWQNAVLALLPLWSIARALLRSPRQAALNAGALGAAFSLGILPQLAAWQVIFGRVFIGVPLGKDYLRWSQPFLSEILFSSRHGLFSWSPLLLFATLGLAGFARQRPAVGLPLCGLLALIAYINSAVADWWAGGSFGARRFDAALPIFSLGLATVAQWLIDMVRRRPGVVLAGLLAVFISVNLLFMEQYRKGRLPTDNTISYEAAARGILEDFFDGVGYPFSFPANWAFSLRYDRPLTQYDLLVGKYLFHLQNNLGGVIDLGEEDPPFIGNGWSTLTDWQGRRREVRLAAGERSGLFVPTDRPETLRVVVECAVPAGSEPQWVEVWLNGSRLGGFRPGREMSEQSLLAEKRWWRRLNLLEFARGEDFPGPFLAVDRVRFERVQR